jgi:ABC-type transporter Mla subunit MlaD
VYFAGPTGLREGSAVRIAGRSIGELTSISIVPASRTWAGHPLEGTGGVVATLKLDRDWAARVPRNSEIFVGGRSLLAPRYVEIGPPRGEAPARPLGEDDAVRGVDPPDLDRVLQRTWDILGAVDTFMDEIRPSSQALTMAIARLTWLLDRMAPPQARDATGAAVAEATALLAELEQGGLDLETLPRLLARARAVLGRIEIAIAALEARADAFLAAIDRAGAAIPSGLRARIDRTVAAFTTTLERADTLTAQLRGVLDDATTGAGTLAALGRDLELFDDLKQMTKDLKRAPWRVVAPPP